MKADCDVEDIKQHGTKNKLTAKVSSNLAISLPPIEVKSIAISVSVCLSVCPLTYLKIQHVQISRNFLYMTTMAIDQSSSDDNAIRYVLPVL